MLDSAAIEEVHVGHGRPVAVLLKVYANCIDGQAGPANQRISDALDGHDSE